MISSIEFLKIEESEWVQLADNLTKPLIFPFVSTIGHDSLLIYGGNFCSDGVVIGANQVQRHIEEDYFAICSNSFGVMTRIGVAVGLAIDNNNQLRMVAFRPETGVMETIVKYGDAINYS